VLNSMGTPQRVLLLGGGSEIGVAIVERLLGERPAHVILAGRDPLGAGVAAAASRLRAHGHRVDPVGFDAAATAEHEEIIDKLFADGDIDVAVLAFGVLGDQRLAEDEPTTAVPTAMTNYVGAVSAGGLIARAMRRQGHGAIVALSSVAAERPRRANFVYGSTKAGLDAYFTGLADALRGTGVRVLVVRPGFVRTRMTANLPPAPMATTPDVVARAAVAGLRRGAATVWAPAKLRAVMTVLRHLPGPIFRRLGR
jgi:decaprenylphospho-beta-D-erythro-pentofuranosid-2-ulose 2-reductase